MKNNKRKLSIINVVGILLIVGGLSIIGFQYVREYRESAALERDRQELMDNIFNIEEGDIPDGEVEQNPDDANVWALISIDDINLSLPVKVGDDFSLMRQYLMAYNGSALPPNPGNVAIAGHRGNCPLCGFKKLEKLKGDAEIKIIAREATYVYEMFASFVVDKSETWVLDDIDDKTTLTLITCVDVHGSPERQIVQAELVEIIPNN